MSKRITKQVIDKILTSQGILFWAQKYIKLNVKGSNAFSLCPFHHEKTPSFSINIDKNFFYCFGCQKSGNAIDLVMQFENLAFYEAVKTMAVELGIDIQEDDTDDELKTVESVANAYYSQMKKCQHSINYLKGRGIKGTTAKEFNIGRSIDSVYDLKKLANVSIEDLKKAGLAAQSNRTDQFYPRFRNRLMFPIQNIWGQNIGFGARELGNGDIKYLNSSDSPWFSKSHVLYGIYQARKAKVKSVCVVEGYFDVIQLWQHGFHGAIAPMGTSLTSGQFNIINRNFNEVIFCFDSDNAGQKATQKALEKSLQFMRDGLEIKFIQLPQGEDPDSYILNNGIDAWQQLIKDATPIFDHININYLDKTTMQTKISSGIYFKELINNMPNSLTKHALTRFIGSNLDLGDDWMNVEAIEKNEPKTTNKEKESLPRLWMALLTIDPAVLEQLSVQLDELKEISPSSKSELLNHLLSSQNIHQILEDNRNNSSDSSIDLSGLASYLQQNNTIKDKEAAINLINQLTIQCIDHKIRLLINRLKSDSRQETRDQLDQLIRKKLALRKQLKLTAE
tara:strand:- start:5038 stop:6729 length:1692 start_codon:yes stop_codon:yes gene_type:complete